MADSDEFFDSTELPPGVAGPILDWLHRREQMRGNSIRPIRLNGLTVHYRVLGDVDLPEGEPAERPERTHQDFGPRLPRSHDPGERLEPAFEFADRQSEEFEDLEDLQPHGQGSLFDAGIPTDWDPQF